MRTGWTDHGVDLTADELVEVLRSEIEEYNAWATGEVYGYIVERSTTDAGGWEEVDSCWGHIGHTWAVEAATDALTEAVQHGAAEYTLQQAAAAEDEAEIESLRLIEVGA